MKIYEVEFRASLKVAAESEEHAVIITTKAITDNPGLIYVEAVNSAYEKAWGALARMLEP